MSTIATILAARQSQKDQEKLETDQAAEQHKAQMEANLQKIIGFLKETQEDPKYGPLLSFAIHDGFETIIVTPSEQAFELMGSTSGEHPDDIDWGPQSVRVTQNRKYEIVIQADEFYTPIHTPEEGLPIFQEKVADMLESIIEHFPKVEG